MLYIIRRVSAKERELLPGCHKFVKEHGLEDEQLF
jgi:hypothetical protein